MADAIRDWLLANYKPDSKCGSPMEALLDSALNLLLAARPLEFVNLTHQGAVGDYRADFLFVVAVVGGGSKRLVVEVDGHDYHERTKEQARHDKQRDRFMVGEGIEVLRYTGSEVWANPFSCADEVISRCEVARFGCTRKQARVKAIMEDMRRLFEEDDAA